MHRYKRHTQRHTKTYKQTQRLKGIHVEHNIQRHTQIHNRGTETYTHTQSGLQLPTGHAHEYTQHSHPDKPNS